MFGFGMSAIDKVILAKTERALADFGLSGDMLRSTAKRLFDETKAETEAIHGNKLYVETFGDHLAQNVEFMAKRRAEGLTEADVRKHWNRCLLLVLIELKLRTMAAFVFINSAEQAGLDPAKAASEYRNRRRSMASQKRGTTQNRRRGASHCETRTSTLNLHLV